METIKATVEGKVQGVLFRKYTQIEANKLGLTGLVTNQIDGTVYIESCGTKIQLDSFIKWLNKGSPFSRVDKINLEWGIAMEKTDSFVVKY